MSNRVYYDIDDADEAKQPFLGNLLASRHPSRLSLPWKIVLSLHWIAISILCFLTFTFYKQSQRTNASITEELYCEFLCLVILQHQINNVTSAPAQHVIRSENIVFTSGFGRGRTKYMGEPNPQNDAAWSDLYNCQYCHWVRLNTRIITRSISWR